ncbi:Microtubule-Associated Proteins 1A/1B Light Chain 3C [Manis pentadactyla]|nr:Microtubule-Associated Proteins 1A/1B Light Chain 3C [Manis pentadactyla]
MQTPQKTPSLRPFKQRKSLATRQRKLLESKQSSQTRSPSRMVLRATEAFYLLVNSKSLVSMSMTMAEIYRDYKVEDGFVYTTYASQEKFGGLGWSAPRDGSCSGAHPAILCSPPQELVL